MTFTEHPTPQPHGSSEPPSGTHGTYRGGWLNGFRECAKTHKTDDERWWAGFKTAQDECSKTRHGAGDATQADEHRAFLRGRLAGFQAGAACFASHGVRDARWYSKGLSAGLRSGRRQGFTSGVTRGLLVAFGLACVARWLGGRG